MKVISAKNKSFDKLLDNLLSKRKNKLRSDYISVKNIMVKNFLSKILARDLNGLNIISTYCEDSTTSVSEIKYLKKNKIFLLSLTRKSLKDNKKSNIISVCKFEFIENVVAKNVDQKDSKLKLKLMGIDVMKIDKQYEINLLFSDNRFITLYSEIIEVILEDLKKK